MDVDDLFGDTENVNMQAINATHPVKGLARRIDELGSSGCCQRIAWSKNGCVAYISPDGYAARLKVFHRDAETAQWDLGMDVPLEFPPNGVVYPLVHLSWSHLGNDLAVMNEAGHVMVFSCAMALDRLQCIPVEVAHPESEADPVVGLHWLAILPYEQKNHIAWSATREGAKWKWNIRSHKFHDAHHPVDSKASFIYLKSHGELRLRFQQFDSTWQESLAQVGPIASTKEPFTHAAFASNNDNTLLLAAYDVKRRLHLYRIETVWHIPTDKQHQRTAPFDKPTIQVSLIKLEDSAMPVGLPAANLGEGIGSQSAEATQLIHLHFLPTTPDHGDGSLPTIQAIFTKPPNLIVCDQMSEQETPHSVVVKWAVLQMQQNQVHPSLDHVTSKKKGVSSIASRTMFLLQRQPEFTLHALVLAFYPVWYNMMLAFYYSDGTIEFRKRSTMEPIIPDGNNDTVTSLLQAGFVFPHSEPSLHIAFSPNRCLAVCMQDEGSIKLRSVEYRNGPITDDDDPQHSAALAALVLQSSSAANQYYSSDDIFAILGPLSERRKQDFTTLLFDGLDVNIDCGIDDTSNNHLILLGRSPFFVKILSAMHILGLEGTVSRSLTSKTAWIILNIKYVTQILTTIARMHSGKGTLEATSLRPEAVPQLIGICRWIMHFMAYILDELFSLGREVEDIPSASLTRELLEQKIRELNKPAILLLLSAFPRLMMKSWVQPIAWVKRSADTLTHASTPVPSPEMRRLYTPLHTAVNELPFEWRWFDTLVSETHALVRTAYKHAHLTDTQRNALERDILQGTIPPLLFPAAKRLVTDRLWNSGLTGGCLADKLDAGRLMFFDTTWLGFTDSRRARAWHRAHVVDVCQKVVIRGVGSVVHAGMGVVGVAQQPRDRSDSLRSVHGGALGIEKTAKKPMLRQCVRCGEYMEDVVLGLPGYSQTHATWLMGVAKHCNCGNSWMLVEGKKEAK